LPADESRSVVRQHDLDGTASHLSVPG
jgi:hypothetical protein